MFLAGTRLEPWRAGISATAEIESLEVAIASDSVRIVVDIDGLQIGVDVERLRASLAPAISRLAQSTKGHVRLAAVGSPIHNRDARLDAVNECHCPVQILCVNRSGQSERRVIGQRHRLFEIPDAIQTGDRSEQLSAGDLII